MQVKSINCQPIKSFSGKRDYKGKTDKQSQIKPKEQEYSNWGGNYAFPITVITVKKPVEIPKETEIFQETPEEYYARKINSPEWLG